MDDRNQGFEPEALRDAFERMTPSPEAEARMLANLQAATVPAAQRRMRRRVTHIVLPIAACLVLLTGVGVLALSWTEANFNLQMTAQGTSSAGEAAPESAATPELATIYDGLDATPRTSDPAGAADVNHPLVHLSTGELIRIVFTEEGPLAANPATLGNELEHTQAFNETEDESVSCTVLATSDETYPYAVRFEDGSTYLAAPVAE